MSRLLKTLTLAVVVAFAGSSLPAQAAEHDAEIGWGTIKSVGDDNKQFVLTDGNNKEWRFYLADDARLRVDANDLKLSELKAGDKVIVAYSKDGDRYIVRDLQTTRTAVGDFLRDLELGRGTVKSVDAGNNSFMLTDLNNKEWTFHKGDQTQVRLNNKDAQFNELKAGDRVVLIYTKKDGKNMIRDIRTMRN